MIPNARNLAALLVLASAASLSHGQSGPDGYPTKAVRLIVPAAAGSLTDPVARIIAQDMGSRTRQNWIVENRPGAGGIVGTEAAARAAADGYTLMLTANNFIITPSLYRNVPYKVPGDFSLIGLVGRGDNLLVASSASNIGNIAELVRLAKASSSPMQYTSPLIGSAAHLTVELFKRDAGIALTHVAYNNAGQGLADTVSGLIPINVMGISTALPYIQSGKLVPLAWTGPRRPAELPQTPTFVEAGFSNVHMGLWFALVGPSGLPEKISAWLTAQLNESLRSASVIERLGAIRIDPLPGPADELVKLVAKELPLYRTLAAETGLKLD
jgi:tripartite-type tricarboxylate transporter receptor subunit TctC